MFCICFFLLLFFADVRPARPDQGGALASRPGLGEDRGNLPDREEGAFPVLRTGRRATADAAWHYARGRVEAARALAGGSFLAILLLIEIGPRRKEKRTHRPS